MSDKQSCVVSTPGALKELKCMLENVKCNKYNIVT